LDRLEEGWAAYRWRHDRRAKRTVFPHLLDNPGDLHRLGAKRVRIRTEQGIGDALFFLRFAPSLLQRGHKLVLSTSAKLKALLQTSTTLFEAVEEAGGAEESPCDVEIFDSDLPLATTATAAHALALALDGARVSAMRNTLAAFGPPPYIGVTWRAGLLGEEQRAWRGRFWTKHVPVEEFANALRDIDARILMLQRKPDERERAAFIAALGRRALDLSALNDDLSDALALLWLLDAYVGVSNTNMHLLAGLTKRSGHVLVGWPPEWRWGISGDESRWFPGFRLYRQSRHHGWRTALAAVRNDFVQRLS
jgi:hypothetical protein